MSRFGWAAGFVVLWSSGFVGAALAKPAGSVAGVLAWRYVVTSVLLSIAVLVRPRGRMWGRISGRDVVRQGVIGLLAHVVFLGGVFGAAAGGVGVGTVALVCALQPMLVTVAGRAGWGDTVPARQVVGLAVGLVAVVVTVGGAAGASGPLLALPVASLLGLSGAALLERRWHPDVDVVSSLWVQVGVSAVVFVAYAAASGRLAISLTRPVAGAMVWLVLLSGLGGYAAFVRCLRTLGSTTTSLLLYLTPPVTTLWAWAMLAQSPSLGQVVGLGLGAVAVTLAWPAPPGPPRATRSHPVRPARPRGFRAGPPVHLCDRLTATREPRMTGTPSAAGGRRPPGDARVDGRPIARWPRVAAGRYDDLDVTTEE